LAAITIDAITIITSFAFVLIDHIIAAGFIGGAIGVAAVAASAIGVRTDFLRARIDHPCAAANRDTNFVAAKCVAGGTEGTRCIVGHASTSFDS